MKTKNIKLLTLFIFLFCAGIGFSASYIKTGNTKSVFRLIYNPPPTKPVAKNDSVTICENSGVVVINVQANDNDADGDPLTTSIYLAPKSGIASLNGNFINYTPNNNFSGKDTITYVVCDNETPENCDTAMVFITVNASPVAITGGLQTMCYGDTISIGGASSANLTYKWTPNSGLSIYTTSNPKASPTDTTMYTLVVTDTLTGCKNTDSVKIIVKPVPSAYITEGDTAQFCAGSVMSLTASNGSRYLWSNGDTTKTISITSAGDYYVGVTYADGCTDYTAQTFVIINPLPKPNAGRDTSVCLGDSVRIGTPAPLLSIGMTYKWTPATGLNYDTIPQPNASPLVTTKYVLTLTDTLIGCSNTDTVLVTVLSQPVANAGTDKTICKGDTATIGSAAVAGISYSWSPAGGLSSSTNSQPNADPIATTTYVLTASNGICSNTDTVIVTVLPQPIANAGVAKGICKNDSVVLGTPYIAGLTYSWSPAAGLNYDTVAQPKASPASTTTYTLIVSNGACSNKDTVTVSVHPQPIANAGSDKSICKGDSVSIGSVPVIGISYTWSPAGGLSSSTSSQPNASPVTTTTYVVKASNGICSNTDTVVVTVNPLPTANAGANKTICKGDSTAIGSASVLGVTYSWSPSTGLASSTSSQTNASPIATTTYVLTATNGTCSNKDTVIVTVSPQPIANAGSDKTVCRFDSVTIGSASISGVTYSWAPAAGLSSSTNSQPSASPVGTTTYVLTATNGVCSNTDTVVVTVNPAPTANAGADKNICKGDSTSIGTVSLSGITYSWSPAQGLSSSTVAQPNASPISTTIYTLTTNNGTCSKTDIVTVTVLPTPIANAGADKGVCIGDSTAIGSASVAGMSYSWSPITGLSSATISQPQASPITTTTYVVTATNGVCSATDTVVVSVSTPPTANAGSYKTICRNDSAMIGTTATTGLKYNWTPSSGLSSDTISDPAASPAATTLYTLTVTNLGCSNTDTVTVKVNQLPAANTGAAQILCGEGSVTLGSASVAGDTYVWTPATGLSSSTIARPTATPTLTTTYTLTETDTITGCHATNEVQVTFGGDDFYTGISPNGDGINDWWNIPMLDCYQDNTVQIINRWGSEVWSGSNYNNTTVRWDGKDNNGTNLPDGTYYYIVKYNNTEKRGWVFIKR